MTRRRKPKGRRGAAVLMMLVLSSVLLAIFAGTFQTYRFLRKGNQQALKELQTRADDVKVKRRLP